jgi:hypothetical protein
MFSLNADRFWTILFTIPLPMVLNSVAVGQAKMVDPEPIRIVRQTTIDPAIVNVENSNFHQPESIAQGAQRWIDPAAQARRSFSENWIPHVEGCARPTIVLRYAADQCSFNAPLSNARNRCDEFVSFDSHAPPESHIADTTPGHHGTHLLGIARLCVVHHPRLIFTVVPEPKVPFGYRAAAVPIIPPLKTLDRVVDFTSIVTLALFNSAATGLGANTGAPSSRIAVLLNARVCMKIRQQQRARG